MMQLAGESRGLNSEMHSLPKAYNKSTRRGWAHSLRKTFLMEGSCSSSENHPTTVNLFRGSRAMALYRLYRSTTAKADLSNFNCKAFALLKGTCSFNARITLSPSRFGIGSIISNVTKAKEVQTKLG